MLVARAGEPPRTWPGDSLQPCLRPPRCGVLAAASLSQAKILPGSPSVGRTLAQAQAQAQARTGASIVAVVRDGQVIVSLSPDLRFEAEDVVVVVGTPAGVAAVVGNLLPPPR